MFEPLRKRFHFGDIVKTKDDDDKIYRIQGYTVSVHFESDFVARELLYDLSDAYTDEFAYPAYDDELELVCNAEESDEFMANRERHNPEESSATIKVDAVDGELIDFLLDKYNESMWANRQLRKIVPDIAKEFRKDAKAVLAELKELMSDE